MISVPRKPWGARRPIHWPMYWSRLAYVNNNDLHTLLPNLCLSIKPMAAALLACHLLLIYQNNINVFYQNVNIFQEFFSLALFAICISN